MAPAHGGLEVSARLRRQGGETGCILQGQRSIPAEALAQNLHGRHQAGGSGFRGRLPGPHAEAPDLRPGEGNNRVEYAPVHSPRAVTVGNSRWALQTGQGARAEGRRASTGVEQRSYQSERHAGGTGEGWKPRHETGPGKGTRSLRSEE